MNTSRHLDRITSVVDRIWKFLKSLWYKIITSLRKINSQRILAICAVITIIILIYYNNINLQHSCDEFVTNGDNSYENGDYREAIENFGRALDKCKENGNAWRKKGSAYLNIGINNGSLTINRSRAYSNARSLIEFYNSSDDPVITNQDSFENAYHSFDMAYKSNPKDFEALLYRAIASLYLSSSFPYDPITEFKETMTTIGDTSNLSKDSPIVKIKYSAWYGECVSYRKIGSKEKAEECFQNLFKEPEIKIVSPKKGDKVPVFITVSGTFSGKLPEERYMWLFVNSEETPNR